MSPSTKIWQLFTAHSDYSEVPEMDPFHSVTAEVFQDRPITNGL